jgi:hypothetical protein
MCGGLKCCLRYGAPPGGETALPPGDEPLPPVPGTRSRPRRRRRAEPPGSRYSSLQPLRNVVPPAHQLRIEFPSRDARGARHAPQRVASSILPPSDEAPRRPPRRGPPGIGSRPAAGAAVTAPPLPVGSSGHAPGPGRPGSVARRGWARVGSMQGSAGRSGTPVDLRHLAARANLAIVQNLAHVDSVSRMRWGIRRRPGVSARCAATRASDAALLAVRQEADHGEGTSRRTPTRGPSPPRTRDRAIARPPSGPRAHAAPGSERPGGPAVADGRRRRRHRAPPECAVRAFVVLAAHDRR